MSTSVRAIISALLLCVLPACWQPAEPERACVVSEYFMTDRDVLLNVDSVAVWHGAEGQHWLIATAKTGNTLPVYDATTGQLLKTIGSSGDQPGQLQRPNGIAVQDNFLFIVERDNKRLQIFNLPDGQSIGITDERMGLPYGLAVVTVVPGQRYMIYVTDNAGEHGGKEPKKVHQYDAIYDGQIFNLRLIRSFGDTTGDGALWKVESIAADPYYNRLFVADEHKERKNVKIYTLDGKFTGKTIGNGLILYEPEGIALYELNDQEGYVILTDQDRQENTFWIFDRVTLKPIRSFIGNKTRNTDGIATSNQGFGPFVSGALYAVHDDGNIHAYDWHTLAKSCHLEEKRP